MDLKSVKEGKKIVRLMDPTLVSTESNSEPQENYKKDFQKSKKTKAPPKLAIG